MKMLMSLLLLTLACGGATDETEDASPVGEEDAAPEERVIPLCEGSPEQTPGLCQELRYGQRGYCNYWHECD
jgi:hypothetical protein